MEFEAVLEHIIALLQRQGRISSGALKRRFELDDAYLEDLKIELIEELYRLKGELLLAQSARQTAEAETCFHQALDIARRQQAKSLELRAAMNLSRLWQRQGKRDVAHKLLAEVYGWFTEGFDTADLQEAKALLEELA